MFVQKTTEDRITRLETDTASHEARCEERHKRIEERFLHLEHQITGLREDLKALAIEAHHDRESIRREFKEMVNAVKEERNAYRKEQAVTRRWIIGLSVTVAVAIARFLVSP